MATQTWQGLSGQQYEFDVLKINGTEWYEVPGLYIFCHSTPGVWWADYIGHCQSFKDRICSNHHKWDAALARGATHVHAMVHHGGELARRAIERDLIARWKPPCNEVHV